MKCRHTYLFAGLCALLFGACTGNFRDINDDLSGITDGELEADNNGLGYRLTGDKTKCIKEEQLQKDR